MNSKPKTYEEALKRVGAGERFEDYETLSLANDDNYRIAHAQAARGWKTRSVLVLNLADKYGFSVKDEMMRYQANDKTSEHPITIIVKIYDRKTVEDYKNLPNDVIIDDFLSNPYKWRLESNQYSVIKDDKEV